jgi:hypothetical protein
LGFFADEGDAPFAFLKLGKRAWKKGLLKVVHVNGLLPRFSIFRGCWAFADWLVSCGDLAKVSGWLFVLKSR